MPRFRQFLQLWGVGTLESCFNQPLWIHALINNHAQFRNPSQGFGFVADWTRKTRVSAALLNSVPKFLQSWSVLWPRPCQIQGTNMMSSFCCFSVLSSDVGARGYFKSNVAFWPSLVTSSLGEDMPKSWLLGIITPQHCFQIRIP